MLTRDLLRFTCRKGRIYPTFIKNNEAGLNLAGRFIDLYSEGIDEARSDLEDQSSYIYNAHSQVKVAKGLNKICLDRSDFSVIANDSNLYEVRKELFKRSAKSLSEKDFSSIESYRQDVLQERESDFDLYGDLPSSDRLLKFKIKTADDLINRYNVSQVQGLLLNADSLIFELSAKDPAAMRRLFRYLKFFRLLAEVTYLGDEKYRLKVDGPLSILEKTNKYGLQLASFFTAILDLKQWSLLADIRIGEKQLKLELDQKSRLKGWYRNFLSYVPEEVKVFAEALKEKEKDWHFVSSPPVISLPNQRLIFPDFCFENKEGHKVSLELFHSWHAGPLLQRLEEWPHIKEQLIIGVDRSLIKKLSLENDLENNALFTEKGFLYRDFPGVLAVRRILKSLQKSKGTKTKGKPRSKKK